MFDFLVKAVDNALSIPAAILNGEDISRQQLSKMIADGISIAVIAQGLGVAEEALQAIIDNE